MNTNLEFLGFGLEFEVSLNSQNSMLHGSPPSNFNACFLVRFVSPRQRDVADQRRKSFTQRQGQLRAKAANDSNAAWIRATT